jgi:protein-S-isoprenylcysteine O-methyltransferase Ste14
MPTDIVACYLRAERQFNLLRGSPDVSEVSSAWRVSGGMFYKVQLQRKVVWDLRHACSCKACNHAFELVIIVVCFTLTAGVFMMVYKSPELKKEREQTGEGMWALLMVLFGITILTAILTVRKLMQRWRKASTDVFVSEV